jgi:hypothetical protein
VRAGEWTQILDGIGSKPAYVRVLVHRATIASLSRLEIDPPVPGPGDVLIAGLDDSTKYAGPELDGSWNPRAAPQVYELVLRELCQISYIRSNLGRDVAPTTRAELIDAVKLLLKPAQ